MKGPLRSLAVVAIGAGIVLGATSLPQRFSVAPGSLPGPVTGVPAQPVAQTQSICPGPETIGVTGLPDSAGQTVSVAGVTAPAASLPSGLAPDQGPGSLTIGGLPPGVKVTAPATERGQIVSAQISTARSASVVGTGALAPGTVATQWSLTKAGERRGLFTAACRQPATSSWLVGGGSAPGRQEHLVLTNPWPNPVAVDVTVFGVSGPIESPNGHGLVVAGHGRTVVLLDAIAGLERSPVVHVVAQGGEVAAVLSDTWLDGVVSRGGDDAGPVAAPAREQVVAGVPIQGRAVLRLGVPGADEAVVQWQLLTPGGPRTLPSGSVTRVAGRSTKDIDLSSLAPGAYAVHVNADVPVVAAVMVERRRGADAPSDLAWSLSSGPIRSLAGMALPAAGAKGVSHRLDLAATDDSASVLVTSVGARGRVSSKEVSVVADSVSTVSLAGATSVWVTPRTGPVRAAVLTTLNDAGGVLLSLTPLADLTLTATPLTLRQLPE